MILIATTLALFSNIAGLVLSYYLDMPIAPVIILVGATIYGLIYLKLKIIK